MRRRPIEFWWIIVFSLFQALFAFENFHFAAGADRAVVAAYGAAFVVTGLLLMALLPAGRVAATIMLGVEAVVQAAMLLGTRAQPMQSRLSHALFLAFSLWMIFYLQSRSTSRVCSRESTQSPVRHSIWDVNLIPVVEVVLCFCAGLLVYLPSNDLSLAGCAAVGCYVVYGLFFADWLRCRWVALFASCERDFPIADAGPWRAACKALARRDAHAARQHMALASEAARQHPASVLFLRIVEWQALLDQKPVDGHTCLRRAAFDHDWKPGLLDRNRIADYIECASAETVRDMVAERTQLVDGVVRAALNPSSFFYKQANRILTRITGEAFAFNPHESWAAWWDEARPHWSGDAGSVSLVARLLRMDADSAAHALASRVAGRAEEPILKELTGQIRFLNAMQKAIRDRQGVESFIKQPQRMLLVPELTDAVGLLHADSPLLESLGMPQPAVARRLNLRVPLVDYIAELWQRYPSELSGDMPWVLKTLTDKNLGVLRARGKFQAWWPAARESFLAHDRAVAQGLAAFAAGDDGKAEEQFRLALAEQPRELSSRYNLALSLMRRQNHEEAARLLQELTRLEPKEHYWWLVLGDLNRNINRSAEAHDAFRRALELGAAAPKVAFHRGLTFARDHHDAEAINQLDRVLGANPSASKIDALVSHLESEGFWKLAGHYREEAFRRGLSPSEGDKDERDGEDISA